MAEKDQMPKVNFYADQAKLKTAQRDYINMIEQQNLERVQKLQKQRKNNAFTACMLGASVLGIYFYSIYAVKQEKFLDDFDDADSAKK